MSTICQLHADLRYYLCMQPVDMRKQFQGLQGIINAEFGRYITQDEAFIFIGKTGTTVKTMCIWLRTILGIIRSSYGSGFRVQG